MSKKHEHITIRVGGVPEHFNYPWHYGIKHGIFQKSKLNIEWVDVKGGSGAMCAMLENNELDVALILTEGIVKHIHNGGQSRIIQQFVKSPLIWGVHSRKGVKLDVHDLSTAKIARSRVGSGSHLMAYVHAQENHYEITEDQFVTLKNIDGAVAAFAEERADILLWERFMTQPYVDQGQMTRIGQCISPWPCFMMVGSPRFIERLDTIKNLGNAIIESTQRVSEDDHTIENIAKFYNLKVDQVRQWYNSVEWQTSEWIARKMLTNVTQTLDHINILGNTPLQPKDLCYSGAYLY